jgi:hypothetical protein
MSRRRKQSDEPRIELAAAWKLAQQRGDLRELDNLRGNNRRALRPVVMLIHAIVDGVPGTAFYLGSVELADLFGTHQRTAHRWLKQLVGQRIIKQTWRGRPCWRDEDGHLYGGDNPTFRASEYIYLGLPVVPL